MEQKMNITYEQALERLQIIVNQIEAGDISIEQLGEKVKEAKKLIEFCTTKLTSIEKEISSILESDQNSDQPQPDQSTQQQTTSTPIDEDLPF